MCHVPVRMCHVPVRMCCCKTEARPSKTETWGLGNGVLREGCGERNPRWARKGARPREAGFRGVPGGATASEGFENIVWHSKDLMETSGKKNFIKQKQCKCKCRTITNNNWKLSGAACRGSPLGAARSSARLPLTTQALVTRLTKIHRKLNERRGKQKWGRWWRSSDLFISQEGGSPREIRAELSRPAFRKLPRVGSRGRVQQRGAGVGSRGEGERGGDRRFPL